MKKFTLPNSMRLLFMSLCNYFTNLVDNNLILKSHSTEQAKKFFNTSVSQLYAIFAKNQNEFKEEYPNLQSQKINFFYKIIIDDIVSNVPESKKFFINNFPTFYVNTKNPLKEIDDEKSLIQS